MNRVKHQRFTILLSSFLCQLHTFRTGAQEEGSLQRSAAVPLSVHIHVGMRGQRGARARRLYWAPWAGPLFLNQGSDKKSQTIFHFCARKVMLVAIWIIPVMSWVYSTILLWSVCPCLLRASFVTLYELFKFPWLWQDLGAYKTPPGRCRRLFTSLTDSLCRLREFAGIMTSKTLYESKMKTLALLY